MKSPLTHTENVRLVKSYPASLVIDLYRKGLSIDISPFFRNIQKVDLFECLDSGYRFYYPLSLEGTPAFYESLINSNFQYYPGWKWENDIAAKYINPGDKLIDVGCGDGTFLAMLANVKPGVHRFGIEFNAEAIKQATAKGLHVFSEPVQVVAQRQKGEYDVATTFQVLEHIADVSGFLKAKADLVKPGGRIIIGVPHNNPYIYRKDKYHVLNLPPHHMGLWGSKSLANLTRYLPLKLESIHIEPVDDLFYYIFVQASMAGMYANLYRTSKLFRGAGRLFNKITRPFAKGIKGRNIVAVYRKL
jgi:SAM-dependent methyltransferase